MVVTINQVTTASVSDVSNHTFSHTTNAGTNRHLFVYIGGARSGVDVTAVTYNGVALVELARGVENARPWCELWHLVAEPGTGAQDVVVTFATEDDVIIGAVTYDGVDQTTPQENAAGTNGGATPATINISSTTDDLVAGIAASEADLTTDGSQTGRWDIEGGNGRGFVNGSDEAGTTTTTHSYSMISDRWAICAVSIIAAGAGSALVEVINETENSSEASNLGWIQFENVTEQISEAENHVLATALLEVINETENVTEGIVLALRKTINETEQISETINLALRKTIDETANISEDIVVVVGKTLDETEDINEGVLDLIFTALFEVINESEEISEGVNLALRKTIDETEDITEAINQLLGLVRFANETENITEVENHVLIAPIVEVVNESVDITEAGDTIKFTNDVEISELINTVVAAAGGTELVNETEDITEALNIQVGKQVDESQDITETVNLALRKVIDETANISETINLALRKVQDSTIDISEAIDNILGKVVVVPLETVDINEAENHVIASIIIKNENEETEDVTEAKNQLLGLVRNIDTLDVDNLTVAQDSFSGITTRKGQRVNYGLNRITATSVVYKEATTPTTGTLQGKIWKDATAGGSTDTTVATSNEIYNIVDLTDEDVISFTFPTYTVEDVEYVIGAEIVSPDSLVGMAHTPDQITGVVTSRSSGNWIDVSSQDMAIQITFSGETQNISETINLSLRKVIDETANISETVNLALRKTIDATEEISEAINSLILSALVEVIDESVEINEPTPITLLTIIKVLDESEEISESINIALSITEDETANITESIVVAHRKNLDRTEEINESVNIRKIITLFSNDTVNISEARNSIIRTPAVFISRKVDALIKVKSTEAIILKKTSIASLHSKTSTSALIFKKAINAILHKKNTDAYVDE